MIYIEQCLIILVSLSSLRQPSIDACEPHVIILTFQRTEFPLTHGMYHSLWQGQHGRLVIVIIPFGLRFTITQQHCTKKIMQLHYYRTMTDMICSQYVMYYGNTHNSGWDIVKGLTFNDMSKYHEHVTHIVIMSFLLVFQLNASSRETQKHHNQLQCKCLNDY